MRYSINGVEIELKDKTCNLKGAIAGDIKPQINLYVRVNNLCNAACKFCEYRGCKDIFNLDKFREIVSELYSRDIIGKIQLTGGEPTLDKDRILRVLEILRYKFPDKFIGINTNGSKTSTLIKINSLIDNIAISRHHYKDKINREIFGCYVPSTGVLEEFIECIGKDKIHFSCNLIKEHIGNIEEVKRYLDWVCSIGAEDVGFVTLMPINEYAKQNQVEFDAIGIEEDKSFLKYREYSKDEACGCCCRCANYLYYSAKHCKTIDVYGRFEVKHNNTQSKLVFDGEYLRDGFGGNIII